jgi:hypothetical protein
MRSFALNEQIVIFRKSHSNVADISYFGCVQESWLSEGRAKPQPITASSGEAEEGWSTPPRALTEREVRIIRQNQSAPKC